MATVGVRLKLDVTKIEKARLFKGQKGTYLDATVFVDIDEADQYGNHGMITQDVTKEEREAGTRGPILGNVKVFYKGDQQRQQQAPRQQTQRTAQETGGYSDFDDSIPFMRLHDICGG